MIAALGDSVTSAGGNGQRPLDIAVAVSDLSMTRLLVLHGADPLVPHAKGDLSIAFTMASKHDPKILQSALQAAFERASVSADGESSSPTASLMCADAAKRLSSFREFAVERDSKGDTAMHCAAERRFLAAPVLAILLRAGADATATVAGCCKADISAAVNSAATLIKTKNAESEQRIAQPRNRCNQSES